MLVFHVQDPRVPHNWGKYYITHLQINISTAQVSIYLQEGSILFEMSSWLSCSQQSEELLSPIQQTNVSKLNIVLAGQYRKSGDNLLKCFWILKTALVHNDLVQVLWRCPTLVLYAFIISHICIFPRDKISDKIWSKGNIVFISHIKQLLQLFLL